MAKSLEDIKKCIMKSRMRYELSNAMAFATLTWCSGLVTFYFFHKTVSFAGMFMLFFGLGLAAAYLPASRFIKWKISKRKKK